MTKKQLDLLYARYNKRELVSPDPLQFLYEYPDIRDREIVGLIASSLAYGRVAQILKSVAEVLGKMGGRPYQFVTTLNDTDIEKSLKGFKHRFHTCSDITSLLVGVRHTIKEYGSLKNCFKSGLKRADTNILTALGTFVEKVSCASGCCMLSSPLKGSACKKLNLYLRWMVRHDDVDPGGWDGVPASKLIVPLDTHMHNISLKLGLTNRKQANIRTAIEISEAFAKIEPLDPVKYDFTLTRFGIRGDMRIEDLLRMLDTGLA